MQHRRLRRDPRGDGRPAGHRPPARPSAARVPAQGRGARPARRRSARSPPDEERLRQAALDWSEQNPMLGIRGVRLAVMKPGLYAMQVRALLDAVRDRVAAGGTPIVEVMIPLTVSPAEMALARSWVVEAAEELGVTRRPADRHDDRDATRCARGRPDGEGRGLLQLRHQRPDADDLRVQPRRRRGQDDARSTSARACSPATRSTRSTSTGWASWSVRRCSVARAVKRRAGDRRVR